MIESATVDLPQPDSPTRRSASPARSERSSPVSTGTSPARVVYATRSPWTSSSGASVTEAELPQPHGEKIEADDERGDGRARDQRHVRPHHHHPGGLLGHAAPVGSGWRQADAEAAAPADGVYAVAG